jgi:hypothetical protein
LPPVANGPIHLIAIRFMAGEPAPLTPPFPQGAGLHAKVRTLGLGKGAHGGVGRLRLEVDVVALDPPDLLPTWQPCRLLAHLLPAPAPAVGVWLVASRCALPVESAALSRRSARAAGSWSATCCCVHAASSAIARVASCASSAASSALIAPFSVAKRRNVSQPRSKCACAAGKRAWRPSA